MIGNELLDLEGEAGASWEIAGNTGERVWTDVSGVGEE